MTHDEHRERHVQFHRMLDEMVADYIAQGSGPGEHLPSRTTLLEFTRWSHEQAMDPTPGEKEG